MNPLPTLYKLDPKDYNLYKTFLNECVLYSHASNIFYGNENTQSDADSFYNWLQTTNLYICRRDNKNIGFIVFDSNQSSVHFNRLSIFVHPKVCKLAIISIARAATIVAYYELNNTGETTFLFSTVHTLVYGVFQNIFSVASLKHDLSYIMSVKIDKDKVEEYVKKNYDQEELKQYKDILE